MNSYTMRTGFRFLQVTMALTITFLLPGAISPAVSADDALEEEADTLSDEAAAAKNPDASPKLAWHLRVLAAGPEARPSGTPTPDIDQDMTSDGVRVVVEHGRRDSDEVENLIDSLGGDVEATSKGRTQCVIPIDSLNALAEDDNVNLVRLPFRSRPEATSEGLEIINADEWQTLGYSGAGVKIGILDTGFHDYATLLDDELPAAVTVSWPAVGTEGTSSHGVACAEIIHDIAPDAALYFASFDTDVEWDNAVAWLISQEVDIISCSVGWYLASDRDGTDGVCDAIDSASAEGILWAQSAGDYAERHWAGTWQDTDDPADHHQDFDTGPPIVNYNSIHANAGDDVWVRIWWDDPWGSSTNDYDLDVYDSGEGHWWSWEAQGVDFDYPYEEVSFTAPATDTYTISIGMGRPSVPVDFEMFCSHIPDYADSSGSISDGAASANTIAVGAVNSSTPNTIEDYSALGPTTDSRTKPDLVAPTAVTTGTYGTNGFEGTSASAPHVAAAAALVMEAHPSYDEEAVQTFLETNAFDLGSDGPDNTYGYGRLLLPEAPVPSDFGDAPDPSYPTLLTSSGAQHLIDPTLYLGSHIDGEGDGQPNAYATGDDNDVKGDDDDGVEFTSAYNAGAEMTLTVTASRAGYLDAWVDFNQNGSWGDTGDQVFTGQALSAGENPLSITVPGDAIMDNPTFARFRFSSAGGLSYTGSADDGEVEDYALSHITLYEGDVTMDGHTNIVDAMFIAQMTVGLRTFDANQLICGDTTDDGQTNIVDAMHIAQYTVDPTGEGHVLFKPLWEEAYDPQTQPPA